MILYSFELIIDQAERIQQITKAIEYLTNTINIINLIHVCMFMTFYPQMKNVDVFKYALDIGRKLTFNFIINQVSKYFKYLLSE